MAGLVLFLKRKCYIKVQEFLATLVLKIRHFCKLQNVVRQLKRQDPDNGNTTLI
jgi:hypothetical protein